jgi:hypothetical protein
MKVLRALAFYGLVNTAVLWIVVCTWDAQYPHRGLVAWTLLNTLGVLMTQAVSLIHSVENDA